MTKEFEDRGTTYSIHENVNIGEVKVADEVVAIIAGLAATEVEGVDSLGGNITSEIVSKLGFKDRLSLNKGRSSSYFLFKLFNFGWKIRRCRIGCGAN